MRNKENNKNSDILTLVKDLPFFSFIDLKLANKNDYLKIILSRYAKKGKLLRLKKGCYVSEYYTAKARSASSFDNYLEFIANILHSPSYLSAEYVLCRHGILSESVFNFTSISTNKTKSFTNKLGNFIYHKIKSELFIGFEIIKNGAYSILKATKAKALFDYLYFRKHLLSDRKAIAELRLNLENFTIKDRRELKKYCVLEGSSKMKNIYNMLNMYI
jgi:hypothetical protein